MWLFSISSTVAWLDNATDWHVLRDLNHHKSQPGNGVQRGPMWPNGHPNPECFGRLEVELKKIIQRIQNNSQDKVNQVAFAVWKPPGKEL